MESYSREQSIVKARTQFESVVTWINSLPQGFSAADAEQGLFSQLLQLGLFLLQAFFARQEEAEPSVVLPLASGESLPRERRRSVDYFSIFGKLEVSRWVYRSPGQSGVSPLDATVNLPDRSYSYLLQEMMGDLAVHQPFRRVSEFLKRYFGHDLSPRTVEQNAEELADQYDAFYEQQPAPPPAEEGALQVVSLDGKGVPMVKAEAAERKPRLGKGEKHQSKKEAIAGVSYTVAPHFRTAEAVVKALMDAAPSAKDAPKACQKRVIASLDLGKKGVAEVLKKDVALRNPEEPRPLACLIDGAAALEQAARAALPSSVVIILDIIHANEYLWEAAHALHPEGSKEAKAWVRERLTKVLEGNVSRVIQGIQIAKGKRNLSAAKEKTLGKVVTYFKNHKHLMRYDQFLAKGFPIGSGVVESACGHVVKARMEGAGMRWTQPRAEALLRLRSVHASEDWDAYNVFRREAEHKRLYSFASPQPLKLAA